MAKFYELVDKLAKTVNQGSVIAADSDGALSELTPTDSNQVLISNLGNLPIWSKITGEHIENRTITGSKIGLRVINNNHLVENIFVNRVADSSLTSNMFKNGAITANKLQAATLNINHIGIIGLSAETKTRLNNIVQGYFNTYPQDNYNWLQEKTITPEKIADNTIDSLTYISGVTARTIAHKSFTQHTMGVLSGGISPNFLHPNFRFQTRHLQNNSLSKTYFAWDVQQAFTAKGC